jgi:hypothetical protein
MGVLLVLTCRPQSGWTAGERRHIAENQRSEISGFDAELILATVGARTGIGIG